MPAPHVLIVGAGIAGASAAYFAGRQGARVTLIDAGSDTASLVPTALVNPVRGTSGKLVDSGFEAARFTFALVESLLAAGYPVQYGRGLCRPVPDAATKKAWQDQLPKDAPVRWEAVPAALGLQGSWHAALYLPEAGWIDTRTFLRALIAESHAEVRYAEVTHVDPLTARLGLIGGETLEADHLLWCGGARGAAQTGPGRHTFRPGSVLILQRPLTEVALSYGIYAAPCHAETGHGVVGSTSEPRANAYHASENGWALERLEARVRGMWHEMPDITGDFRGVRFERHAKAVLPTLDGFGSRGYLLAPRAAARWAAKTFGAPISPQL